MKLGKIFSLIFWLLAGLLVGSLLARACAGVSFLAWLAYSESIAFAPAANLIVLDFTLDVTLKMNLAQVLCILGAMFCYHRFHF